VTPPVIVTRLKTLIRTPLHGFIVAAVPRLLSAPGVMERREHFREWERRGYHILPVGLGDPVPNTAEVGRRPSGRSALAGITWRANAQLALLERIAAFAPETEGFATQPSEDAFYLGNTCFDGIDPHVYHCLVRTFRPHTIVEVGAGYSTLVAANAGAINGDTRVVAIEPHPRDFIAHGAHAIEHIHRPVQDVPLSFFKAHLRDGDILFIDSSHMSHYGSDVNYLILDVIPSLDPGVLVHVHDVFLPYDYPRQLLRDRIFHSEQYPLQAYLADNDRVEVLLGNHYLCVDHRATVQRLFPRAKAWTGGSFWFRRVR
jgi:hypothetical protein